MKKILIFVLAGSCLVSTATIAQTFSLSDLYDRGEYVNHGYHPTSLESLVGSAAIIVKGRFDRFVKNGLFYGFDLTREEYQKKYNYSDELADMYGLPISDYAIKVDEVFLGDETLEGTEIIYRIGEALEFYRNESINYDKDALFFLGSNPDGSYTPIGVANVQYAGNGIYSYGTLAPTHEPYVGRTLDFVSSVEIDSFEQLIKIEIRNQYSDRGN